MKVIMVLISDLWKLSCFDLFNWSKAWLVYNNKYTELQMNQLFLQFSNEPKLHVLLMVRQVEILFAIIPVPNYHYYPVLHIKLFSSLITYIYALFWCFNFVSLFIHHSICYWSFIVSFFIYSWGGCAT